MIETRMRRAILDEKEFEGTWEEILRNAEELAGRRVRLIMIPEEELSSPIEEDDPTLRLFAQWDAEDETDDPEEIAVRNREWEELKASLNAERKRSGARLLFP